MSLGSTSVSDLSIRVFADTKSRHSFCWNYFGSLAVSEHGKKRIVRPEQVFCLACLMDVKNDNDRVSFDLVKIKSYNKTVSTGNLNRHLREIHNIEEPKIKIRLDEPSSSKTDKTAKSKKTAKSRKTEKRAKTTNPDPGSLSSVPTASMVFIEPDFDKNLARDMALWSCKSLQPFDYMCDGGTTDFFTKYNILKNEIAMPSQEAVSGPVLSELYDSTLAAVKETILRESPRHCAVSADPWRDRLRNLNYLTLTLHYLTCEFELKSFTLCTRPVCADKIEEQLKSQMRSVDKMFGLDCQSIHNTHTTGGTFNQLSMNTMDYQTCLGRGLHNLVTVDGINSVPEVKAIVTKCKYVVQALTYRLRDLETDADNIHKDFLESIERVGEVIEKDEVEPLCENDFLSLRDPLEDSAFPAIPTRWHVVLDLLESLENCRREIINKALTKIGKDELRFTQNDWSLLDGLVIFFKRFREPVEILTSQACTINLALVFRSEIIDILNSISDEEYLSINRLKINMMAKIDQRLPITNKTVAAALLDNRFVGLKEIDAYLETQNLPRASFLAACIREVITEEDLSKTSGLDEFQAAGFNECSILDKLVRKHCANLSRGIEDDPIDEECWRYVSSANPLEPRDGNLLSHWNAKKQTYPWLATFAKHILCIPVTSIPMKRMFSMAGLEFSTRRSRISPTKADKMIFVYENHRVLDDTRDYRHPGGYFAVPSVDTKSIFYVVPGFKQS